MNKDQADKIKSLIKLDIDAVAAYEEALQHIETPSIHKTINMYREDHRRHVTLLSDLLTGAGEVPPERTKDVKGFFIEGFTSLRSVTGEDGALKAMLSNEKITNRKYQDAYENWDLDPEVLAVVSDNYEDERRHLSYIEDVLQVRV
ncbi:MAG: PA2169 family four-helix-bundle protein [Planctomycetaceae bacterium]|nr:PA2169 family four-helix-bundle protein [Planctomycetaceae bacterium]